MNIEELEIENKALKEEVLEQKKTIKALDAVLAEMHSEISEKDNQKSGYPEFKVGKEVYQLLVKKCSYNKKAINEEVLRSDPKLVSELVKIGSGIFQLKK